MAAGRVCPVWIGYLLLSPLRRLRQNPERILRKYLQPGMTALDFGSAMGYFSIPMARLVSPGGRVVCLDIQEKMLKVLRKRAARAGVEGTVETHLIPDSGDFLAGNHYGFDFALLFAVAHEVPDQESLFKELHRAIKPRGKLLFAEPAGHVSGEDFNRSVELAESAGFGKAEPVDIRSSRSVLLRRGGE